MIGYVDTMSTSRSTADVEADVNSWNSWYNMDGMFFDNLTGDQQLTSVTTRHSTTTARASIATGRLSAIPGGTPHRAI